MRKRALLSSVACLFSLFAPQSFAQNRLPQAISTNAARLAVPNTVSPRAKAASDLGAAPTDKALETLSLRFSMTSAQSAALDQLLADQQNPASPRYHQWLTPEQFGATFGLSSTDLATVSSWLTSQGFTVTGIARGHSFITFSGTVGQANQAFGVTLHTVTLNGEQHVANLADPALPSPIANVVAGVTGLNDFRLKPRVHARKVPANAAYNAGTSGEHFIAPGDFYTIYDTKPLLASSINGTGITIAVAGQTDISSSYYNAFRTAAGLSTTNPPTVKLYGTDPGTSADDLPEAMIDTEWSGAIAPSATILYVNGRDVFDNSVTQAIDNDLAPIVTVSYGDCEVGFGASFIAQYNQLFKQANAQGQTVLGPAGDSGAADCDYSTTQDPITYATLGLAVDFPASSPYVTAVGGTEFNDAAGTYWSAANGTNAGSALSYIPEQPWNETYDTTTSGVFFGLNYGGSGGGGVSQVFAKPSWQVGTGVPADASRDVPDLSFNGAAQHDGYLICSKGDCTSGFADSSGDLDVYGGTSVSTPSFAGVLALLEQKLGSKGLGNVNPTLYGLANSSYYSSVFHDVTSGNNSVPCTLGSIDCAAGYAGYNAPNTIACPANSCSGDVTYSSIGYLAGTGYDLASGWGSLDVANAVADWSLVTPTGVTTSALNPSTTVASTNLATAAAGDTITITATVTSGSSSVTTTPTGSVQLLVDNVATGAAVTLANGSATLSDATSTSIPSGQHTFSASYSGDSNYAGSKGSVAVDIVSASSSDFTLTPATSTVTVASGGTAAGITYTVTPTNGFVGDVSFSASSTSTSLDATYSFSVTPVVIAGTTAGTTVLTLEAFETPNAGLKGFRSRSNAAVRILSNPWLLGGSGVTLAGLLLFALPRRRRNRWSALLITLVSVGVLSAAGCSQSGTSTTGNGTINATPGTYSITVTAQGTNAAGTVLTHNVAVTFVVQ